MIKHIAEVHPQTGNIEYLYLSQGVNPDEGTNPKNGLYVVYIYDSLEDELQFVETRYYDFVNSTWAEKGIKPNPFAYWTADRQWQWNDAALLNYTREQRTSKLRLTDWTQLPDAPITGVQKAAAQQYRQELRDMTEPLKQAPENFPTLESISWPTPPEFLSSEI